MKKNLKTVLLSVIGTLAIVALAAAQPNIYTWVRDVCLIKGGPAQSADATAVNLVSTSKLGQVPMNVQQRTGAGVDAFKVLANGQYRLRVDSNGQVIMTAGIAMRFNANSATLLGSTSVSAGTSAIMVFNTSGGAVALTMCAANAVPLGTALWLKDGTGNAATNNITATRAGSDTFITTATGATTLVINTNGGGAWVVSDGTSKWYVWRTTG